jgi:CRP-like cAMP-binding protein
MEYANVLDEDRGFASALSEEERSQARHATRASVVRIERGTYSAQEIFGEGGGLIGLLVLDGLVIRQVVVAGRRCGELVAASSLLRPWDDFGMSAPMPFEVRWRVLTPLRLAILDRRWSQLCARWPALMEAVVERAVERAHTLAFNVAIHCLQHVELRLIVLMWHLADRFGRVGPEGVVIPLKLRHGDIAELVGARRPTVSTAIAELEREGRLARHPRGWLLIGEPPEEVDDMRRSRAFAEEAEEPA